MKMTNWYWNTPMGGWLLWGVWINKRWFIGVSQVMSSPTTP
jgi:hypothetical protein